jgi:SPP1 Gp6-like portal protein
MAYELSKLLGNTNSITEASLRERIEKLLSSDAARLRRLWAYYRNPMRACGVPTDDAGSERPYRQAQEWGLPSRITGLRAGIDMFTSTPVDQVARKEVVIENDIGWRIDTICDYLFGKPIVINSGAPDPQRRAIIEQLLRQVIAHNGGIVFLQQLALLGAVYGYIDVLVKFDASLEPESAAPTTTIDSGACGTADLGQPPVETTDPSPDAPTSDTQSAAGSEHISAGPEPRTDDPRIPGASTNSLEALLCLARRIRLEIVEPARALPILSREDYRCVQGYAQVYQIDRNAADMPDPEGSPAGTPTGSILQRLRARFTSTATTRSNDKALVVEIITPDKWQRYEEEKLVAEGANSLGRVPLVHIQNTAVPFEYSGASDVEPLLPVQDEINCRLSDRAYRITMQSFKMYLGVGIENFLQNPVSPGRMWVTDNENAKVIEFGGDGKTFSEDNHIAEMREAMDKISGVTPIAAGALKGRIGRLTSAAALRVTMLALLAKTERKRTAYGAAIEQMCELALAWLDRAGLFATTPQERRVEIHWPNPVPVNELEQLQEAQAKTQLGVPQEVVLRELGYESDSTKSDTEQSKPVQTPTPEIQNSQAES